MSLYFDLTTPIHQSALTVAMKAAVPSLQGTLHLGTQIKVRRMQDEFTATEEATLRQVLADHDAAAERQSIADRKARRKAAPQAIKNATGFVELKQAVMDLHGID